LVFYGAFELAPVWLLVEHDADPASSTHIRGAERTAPNLFDKGIFVGHAITDM
jgi:hypothetical protein